MVDSVKGLSDVKEDDSYKLLSYSDSCIRKLIHKIPELSFFQIL